jgi:hypothetical protein
VFIARNGRHELTNLMLTSAQVEELVERMLKSSGPHFLNHTALRVRPSKARSGRCPRLGIGPP